MFQNILKFFAIIGCLELPHTCDGMRTTRSQKSEPMTFDTTTLDEISYKIHENPKIVEQIWGKLLKDPVRMDKMIAASGIPRDVFISNMEKTIKDLKTDPEAAKTMIQKYEKKYENSKNKTHPYEEPQVVEKNWLNLLQNPGQLKHVIARSGLSYDEYTHLEERMIDAMYHDPDQAVIVIREFQKKIANAQIRAHPVVEAKKNATEEAFQRDMKETILRQFTYDREVDAKKKNTNFEYSPEEEEVIRQDEVAFEAEDEVPEEDSEEPQFFRNSSNKEDYSLEEPDSIEEHLKDSMEEDEMTDSEIDNEHEMEYENRMASDSMHGLIPALGKAVMSGKVAKIKETLLSFIDKNYGSDVEMADEMKMMFSKDLDEMEEKTDDVQPREEEIQKSDKTVLPGDEIMVENVDLSDKKALGSIGHLRKEPLFAPNTYDAIYGENEVGGVGERRRIQPVP